MKKGRRRFSREFKLETVRQLTSGRQLAQVARELGIDAQVIRRWKDQVTVDAATAFPDNGRVRDEDAEVQRLRQEVTQLRAERDFPKKSGGVLRAGRSVKYLAIQTTESLLSIARRCALLGVSRSGY